MDPKGVKRSVKSWTTRFYQDFFENCNIWVQIKALKIRSVQCYGVNWIPFLGRQCKMLFLAVSKYCGSDLLRLTLLLLLLLLLFLLLVLFEHLFNLTVFVRFKDTNIFWTSTKKELSRLEIFYRARENSLALAESLNF